MLAIALVAGKSESGHAIKPARSAKSVKLNEEPKPDEAARCKQVNGVKGTGKHPIRLTTHLSQ
jgi:hypothetical protein